jgi:hypothetical protein
MDNVAAYEAWRSKLPKELQSDTDYDLYGAFISGYKPSENNHLPDTFKLPNHPTFSNESVYSNEETPGGSWVEKEDGKWIFNATDYNEYEPDVELVLPDQYYVK